MKNSKSVIVLLVLGLTLIALSTAAVAPALKFHFVDVNAPGANETDSYANNNKGFITGDYLDSSGTPHGMILKGTALKTIDDSKGTFTQGYGINLKNQVAGWYLNSSGFPQAFKYAGGHFTDIKIAGMQYDEASGINDAGNITGFYLDSAGVQHGFLKVGVKVTKLDPPGASSGTNAWGINNTGTITIYAINSSGSYISFTTKDKGKTYKAFADPKAGSVGTAVHTPNNKGDVVGTYFDTSNVARGTLFHGGKYYEFNDPKATNPGTRGDGINDTLLITGRYGAGNGNGGFGYKAQAH